MDHTPKVKMIDPEKADQYILSIRIQPDGIYYTIHHPELSDFFISKEIKSENHSRIDLSFIEKAIYAEPILLNPFKKTFIIVSNDHFTWVPEEFFDPEEENISYNYCFPGDQSRVLSSSLKDKSAYLLFGLDKEIYGFIQRTFGNITYLHSIGILCEFFKELHPERTTPEMYAHLQNKQLYLFCFDSSGLILANTFSCKTAEDIVYYILNVWEQLSMNQQQDRLSLMINMANPEQVNSILKKYIKNICSLSYSNKANTENDENIVVSGTFALPACLRSCEDTLSENLPLDLITLLS